MDLRMETSQAVSMLQPFRHPKPGLIIMNKEEKFKQNLPVFLYDDNGEIRIGRYGDTIVTDEWNEFLDKYTQQVSREKIFHYEMWKISDEKIPKLIQKLFAAAPSYADYILSLIGEWIKNQ